MNNPLMEQHSNAAQAIALRPVVPEDEAFLYEVYASTRREEMAAWGWPAAQQDMFLRMQFNAQQLGYDAEEGQREHHLILLDGAPVGRLLVARNEGEIVLVDIALLTEHRGGGVGSALIKGLCEKAAREDVPLRLHVLKTNLGAKRLYERLGFKTTGESGMHFMMEWRHAA